MRRAAAAATLPAEVPAARAGRAPIAMETYARLALAGAALLLLSITAGFYFQWSWATDLWPWPDSRLSYIFLASILAAIALPTLWIAISGELGAIQPGALNLAVVHGGACIYSITLLGGPGQPDLAPYVATFGGALLTTIAAFVLARRIGFRDQGAVPAVLRVSFGLLAGSWRRSAPPWCSRPTFPVGGA